VPEPALQADLAQRLRRAAERAQSGLREALAGAGLADLTPAGWTLLRTIRARGPLLGGEAAEALSITPAAISQTAAPLLRAGWLRERSDPGDARLRRLELGPLARAQPARLEALERALDAAWEEALGPASAGLARGLAQLEAALAAEPYAQRVRRHA